MISITHAAATASIVVPTWDPMPRRGVDAVLGGRVTTAALATAGAT